LLLPDEFPITVVELLVTADLFIAFALLLAFTVEVIGLFLTGDAGAWSIRFLGRLSAGLAGSAACVAPATSKNKYLAFAIKLNKMALNSLKYHFIDVKKN
jgi:hypothetical protein